MNDKQKVVFKQLQLAGLGVVVFVFGLVCCIKKKRFPLSES